MTEKARERQKLEQEMSRIESSTPFRGPFIKVREDVITTPERIKVWHIVETPKAVAILPIDPKGNLVLIEQWRRAIQRITLEIPAGIIDPGEQPIECAQRELREETGFFAQSLQPMGGYFMSPGMITEYVHFFLAAQLVIRPLTSEEDEGIDVKIVSLEKALDMIASQEINDAKTALAILQYSQYCTP